MRRRILRTASVTVACLLGAVGAFAVGMSSGATVVVIITATVVGATVTVNRREARPHVASGLSQHDRLATAVRAGAQAAITTVAVLLVTAGIIGLLGVGAAYVIPLLLAAAALWKWRQRADRRHPTAADNDGDGDGDAAATRPVVAAPWTDPELLSVPQLCQAWHRSYWMLRELPAGAARAAVVGNRERLLDELERRDPAGFHRWLHSGASASSDPGRHLTENRTDSGGQAPPAP